MPNKKWRPGGWKNPYKRSRIADTDDLEFEYSAGLFEAGADAILDALLKWGQRIPSNTSVLHVPIMRGTTRTVIYIPDEEKD